MNNNVRENLPESFSCDEDFVVRFQSIIDVTPLTVNLFDENCNIVFCNRWAVELFDLEDQAQYLDSFFDLSPKYQPDGKMSSLQSRHFIKEAFKKGTSKFYWLHCNLDGDEIPCEITLNRIELSNETLAVVGFARDLRSDFMGDDSDKQHENYFLNKVSDKTLLNMVSNLSNEWFFSVDLRTSIIQYYGSIVEIFGQKYTASVPLGSSLERGLVHYEDTELFLEFIENIKSGVSKPYDIRYKQKDGAFRYYQLIYKTMDDENDKPIFVVGKGVDVHEQKILEERSKIDLLTECYNKVTAEELIATKLQDGSDVTHALFIVDIDNFKSINDNFGHFFGDEVLKEVSHKLKVSFRSQDIVARIGGDEFIVFVENTSDVELLESKATKIMEAFKRRYAGADREYNISGSVGIALYPDGGTDFNSLYQSADKALYQAKMLGKNQFVFYSDNLIDGTMSDRTKVENANRIAGGFFDYDLISAVFDLLYERNADDVSVNAVLGIIAQKYNTDRCYIFESFDEGATYDNTYEWVNDGISTEIDNLQQVPAELFEPLFKDASDQGIIYTNDLSSMFGVSEAYDVMANQGIKSFIHAQIKKSDYVPFFLGLDDCTSKRVWSEKEINSLIYISKIISIIFQSRHLQDELGVLTEYNRVSAYLSDYTNDLVYVSDIDTYELLHVNKAVLEVLGNPETSQWKGKMCYEILQGKSAPCDFCTNDRLSVDSFYEWTFFNPNFNKLYLLKDKLVPMGGKLVRLEVATDITQLNTLEKELKEMLEEERLFINCINTLHSGEEPQVSIDRLLAIIANYYQADRCYIFEFNDTGLYINNTYEWCAEGVTPQIEVLQNVERDTLQTWYDKFDELGVFFINALGEDVTKDDPEYELLAAQGITSLVTAPLRDSQGELTGFLGVDNPALNMKQTDLLLSVSRFIANFLDVTQLLEDLSRLSYYDTLTGIKNRHSYGKALYEINTSPLSSLGVAYVDVDDLRSINEVSGTEFGDKVIIRLAQIIRQVFGDNVYRVGGDEFVILNKDKDEEMFENDISVLRAMVSQEDFEVNIGYTWNKNYSDIPTLTGILSGNRYSDILARNLEIEIEDSKFVVYLQPQVDIESSMVTGAEALIRRIGADGMLQPPDSFIPFYEKEGMITKIDLYVFETICKTIKFWKDSGIDKGINISVNCSRVTIIEKGIVEKLSEICERYGIKKSRLIIEITETISGVSEKKMSQITNRFSKEGFGLSLDDFGSGCSNLTTLKYSDFDEIKIDRSLTSELTTDDKSKLLTRVALNLCLSFDGLISVAEGIERQEQHLALKEMRCTKGQGFYFARPMPIDEFTELYVEGGQNT